MLVDAGERAIALRGTVMLAVRGDDRRWCAICVAVDGSIELRVGEPTRDLIRRRSARGEAWLRDHGFVHVVDAWAAPAPVDATARLCAGLLSSALQEGLGTPEDAELVEVLLHPGLTGDAEPPAPSAPHAEHIRYAVRALAARRRGKLSIEGGRPAAIWAWVFAMDGTLVLSPEAGDEWTVSIDDADVSAEADKLGSPSAPLFLSFMLD